MPVNVIDEAAAGLLVGFAAGAVGMMPVHQRVVEAHAEALGARGVDILPHQIPAGTLLGRAVVGQLGVEVAEALMVLGGHHHVFLPGDFSQLGPIASGIRLGLEELGLLLVFRHRNTFLFHRPFVTAEGAVQAPVDEHAEAGFMPPLHAGLASGIARGGRRGCAGGWAGNCGGRSGGHQL